MCGCAYQYESPGCLPVVVCQLVDEVGHNTTDYYARYELEAPCGVEWEFGILGGCRFGTAVEEGEHFEWL